MKMRPTFGDDYRKYMKEFEEQGFMSRVTETQEDGYYTPHHGVYGASKEKIRIVYNASSKTSTGIALNECQFTGARLQDDLAIILMRFRTHKIGITADIKAMYCQVGVHDEHKKYQKILWRKSPTEPVSVYQLNRVAFGQTAAPFLAIRAMQQCASDHEQEFKRGAEIVKTSFYVDDLLTGAESSGTARSLITEITGVLNHGQFPLSKWCSNDMEVNSFTRGSAQDVEIKDPEMKSVLGLLWQPKHDRFAYKVSIGHSPELWTKRNIVSEIGKLYDPNGFIAPIIVLAKQLIQAMWIAKIGWDDPVSDDIIEKWKLFRTNLYDITRIRIPRWLGTYQGAEIQLHGFSDASKDAYGCCIYARTLYTNGQIKVRLIQCKTKVAPIKTLSIPRLELSGAYLLAKLFKVILRTINIPIEHSFCWVDSEVVLQWLHKSPGDLKTFVCNRVAYIQEFMLDYSVPWNWVAGVENPADIASRGATPAQLYDNQLWWEGPPWLHDFEENWPKQKLVHKMDDTSETTHEIRPISMTVVSAPQLRKSDSSIKNGFDLFEAYDNYLTLWHVIAYVYRAAANFKQRNKANYNQSTLTDEELEAARLVIIRDHQRKYFAREIRECSDPSNQAKPKRDDTHWFDQNTNILRLYGRIATNNLTFEQRAPALISSSGSLGGLLMKYVHIRVGHGGAQQMLHFVRQQYWIPKARQLAKTVIHRCLQCRRHHLQTATTIMAQLPAERTTPERPFKQCGVDYMGPINIASKRGRNPQITRGYVSVFVCLVTRAIHLEVVSDGTKEAFVQALRRLFGRRGMTKQMWSDNGTTFVGTNNYLQSIDKSHQQWAQTIEHEFQLKWSFIVPRAPSWGGIWEAAVKSVKKHIIRVVGSQNLTFEEWSTLLAQVEAWVNSRPLIPLTDDPTDMMALTPGHFLIGESLVALPEPAKLTDRMENRLSRWELVQKFNQDIWKRWHTEYLTTLINRTKWKTRTRNFQQNDLVIIMEDNMPPNKWHMGRVIEPLKSRDGVVRAVRIRTLTGDYIRPILKIALLMNNPEETESNILRPVAERINTNLSKHYDKLIKNKV